MLAEQDAETTAIEAADGRARLTMELPVGADSRAVIDSLAGPYLSVEKIDRRERVRSAESREEHLAGIKERLVDCQRLALQQAFLRGFFDRRLETSGEDLAEWMAISSSTHHLHLRTAEWKVFNPLYEE